MQLISPCFSVLFIISSVQVSCLECTSGQTKRICYLNPDSVLEFLVFPMADHIETHLWHVSVDQHATMHFTQACSATNPCTELTST